MRTKRVLLVASFMVDLISVTMSEYDEEKATEHDLVEIRFVSLFQFFPFTKFVVGV